MAVEYAKDKIHCNALCPGCECSLLSSLGALFSTAEYSVSVIDLKSPMTQPIFEDNATREGIEAMAPWGEWGNVENVARCAVFLASDDAAYITGVTLVIDGGYTAQ